jgi:hypothetical protein
MMVLAHNAAALRADILWRDRTLVFLSRQMLQRRYGSPRAAQAAPADLESWAVAAVVPSARRPDLTCAASDSRSTALSELWLPAKLQRCAGTT